MLIATATVTLITSMFVLDFTTRSGASDPNPDLPRTAIVFTGQFDRIHFGLDLLAAGRVEQLFITGVNAKAGLHVPRFAEQFKLTPEQVDGLEKGRIMLAPDANSTLENALESACWLERQPKIRTVALITSGRHMARASLALQRAIAPVDVIRVPSPSHEDHGFRAQLPEFRKFLTTWAMTLPPSALWPVDEPSLCASGTGE